MAKDWRKKYPFFPRPGDVQRHANYMAEAAKHRRQAAKQLSAARRVTNPVERNSLRLSAKHNMMFARDNLMFAAQERVLRHIPKRLPGAALAVGAAMAASAIMGRGSSAYAAQALGSRAHQERKSRASAVVNVRAYYTSSGTYVRAHTRRAY